jgi:hypothetical protein
MKHIHHIIPKHMGGTDDPSNLIELTVEEHAEAHKKLYNEYGQWQDLCAYQALSGRLGQEEILRMKQGMANKGRKRTPEQIENIRQAALKRSERQRLDGTLSEANKKRSIALTGKKKSSEAIDNWRQSRKNNDKPWHTPETKEKISKGLKGNTNRKTS